jgi:hypothetical protein
MHECCLKALYLCCCSVLTADCKEVIIHLHWADRKIEKVGGLPYLGSRRQEAAELG